MSGGCNEVPAYVRGLVVPRPTIDDPDRLVHCIRAPWRRPLAAQLSVNPVVGPMEWAGVRRHPAVHESMDRARNWGSTMIIQLNRMESDPSRVIQCRRTRATPAGVDSRPGQQLMLYHPDQDYRFAGAFLLAMFTALSLFVLFLGVMAWEATGCWALGVYPFATGSMSTWIFGRATVRFAVTGRRGARGDWWLRLSSTGSRSTTD